MQPKKPYMNAPYNQYYMPNSTLPYSPPPQSNQVGSRIINRIKKYTDKVDHFYNPHQMSYPGHSYQAPYSRPVYRMHQRSVSPNMNYYPNAYPQANVGMNMNVHGPGFPHRMQSNTTGNMLSKNNTQINQIKGRSNFPGKITTQESLPIKKSSRTNIIGSGQMIDSSSSTIRRINVTDPHQKLSYQNLSTEFDSTNYQFNNNSNYYKNSNYAKFGSRFSEQQPQGYLTGQVVRSNRDYFDPKQGISFRSRSTNVWPKYRNRGNYFFKKKEN
jgi:hypothetical protein